MPGANEIEIGDAVYVQLEAINASLPTGLEVTIAEGPNELAFELDPNPRLKQAAAAKSR